MREICTNNHLKCWFCSPYFDVCFVCSHSFSVYVIAFVYFSLCVCHFNAKCSHIYLVLKILANVISRWYKNFIFGYLLLCKWHFATKQTVQNPNEKQQQQQHKNYLRMVTFISLFMCCSTWCRFLFFLCVCWLKWQILAILDIFVVVGFCTLRHIPNQMM